jgi:hypothetical protein
MHASPGLCALLDLPFEYAGAPWNGSRKLVGGGLTPVSEVGGDASFGVVPESLDVDASLPCCVPGSIKSIPGDEHASANTQTIETQHEHRKIVNAHLRRELPARSIMRGSICSVNGWNESIHPWNEVFQIDRTRVRD